MAINFILPKYTIERNPDRCIKCGACERQCSNEVHFYDEDLDTMRCREDDCVNCQRCVLICPTHAITIKRNEQAHPSSPNWSGEAIQDIARQANSGAVLLTSMGNPKPYPIYWDHMLLNASQVTNPSIDPLREPMETRVILGSKPEKLEIDENKGRILSEMGPSRVLGVPIMFSAMSFGSISLNAQKSLAIAARELGTFFNTGEGGLHRELREFADNAIVQVASGRFGVDRDYLEHSSMIEIKIGQGAKPGIGGHLPGEKINEEVSKTRMIPEGTDAISPAPHHDIYSIEDLRQLIYSLKEATEYTKPVSVKIAAVHNAPAIASGMARAGADLIVLDGFRGGTGAAPTRIRDNVGIPIELALAAVDQRLREEGIRNRVSLVPAGSFRNAADIVKAIALGADAVYIASAALIALGCHMCQSCTKGKCNWGIATQRPELARRLRPEVGSQRVINLITAWNHEIQEMMGGMGINAIESLRGNRAMLRGVGLNSKELEVLDIKYAGEVM